MLIVAVDVGVMPLNLVAGEAPSSHGCFHLVLEQKGPLRGTRHSCGLAEQQWLRPEHRW